MVMKARRTPLFGVGVLVAVFCCLIATEGAADDAGSCEANLKAWRSVAPAYRTYVDAKEAYSDLTAYGGGNPIPSLDEMEALTRGMDRLSHQWLASSEGGIYTGAIDKCRKHSTLDLGVFQLAAAAEKDPMEKRCADQQRELADSLDQAQQDIISKLALIVAFHDAGNGVVQTQRTMWKAEESIRHAKALVAQTAGQVNKFQAEATQLQERTAAMDATTGDAALLSQLLMYLHQQEAWATEKQHQAMADEQFVTQQHAAASDAVASAVRKNEVAKKVQKSLQRVLKPVIRRATKMKEAGRECGDCADRMNAAWSEASIKFKDLMQKNREESNVPELKQKLSSAQTSSSKETEGAMLTRRNQEVLLHRLQVTMVPMDRHRILQQLQKLDQSIANSEFTQLSAMAAQMEALNELKQAEIGTDEEEDDTVFGTNDQIRGDDEAALAAVMDGLALLGDGKPVGSDRIPPVMQVQLREAAKKASTEDEKASRMRIRRHLLRMVQKEFVSVLTPSLASVIATMNELLDSFVCSTDVAYDYAIASVKAKSMEADDLLQHLYTQGLLDLQQLLTNLQDSHSAETKEADARAHLKETIATLDHLEQQLKSGNNQTSGAMVVALEGAEKAVMDAKAATTAAADDVVSKHQKLYTDDLWQRVENQCGALTFKKPCCDAVVENWKWLDPLYTTLTNVKTADTLASSHGTTSEMISGFGGRLQRVWQDSSAKAAEEDVLKRCSEGLNRKSRAEIVAQQRLDEAKAELDSVEKDHDTALDALELSKMSLEAANAPFPSTASAKMQQQRQSLIESAEKQEELKESRVNETEAVVEEKEGVFNTTASALQGVIEATAQVKQMGVMMKELESALFSAQTEEHKEQVKASIAHLKGRIRAVKDARKKMSMGADAAGASAAALAAEQTTLALLHAKEMAASLQRHLAHLEELATEGAVKSESEHLTQQIDETTARLQATEGIVTRLTLTALQHPVLANMEGGGAKKKKMAAERMASEEETMQKVLLGEEAATSKSSQGVVGMIKAALMRAHLSHTLSQLKVRQSQARPSEKIALEALVGQMEMQLGDVQQIQHGMETNSEMRLDASKEDRALKKATDVLKAMKGLQKELSMYANHPSQSTDPVLGQTQGRTAKRYMGALQVMIDKVQKVESESSTDAEMRVAAETANSRAESEEAKIQAEGNSDEAMKKLRIVTGIKDAAHRAIKKSEEALRSNIQKRVVSSEPCSSLGDTHRTVCKRVIEDSRSRCRGIHGQGAEGCCHAAIEQWQWGRAAYSDFKSAEMSSLSASDDAEPMAQKLMTAASKKSKEVWERSPDYQISVDALKACLTAGKTAGGTHAETTAVLNKLAAKTVNEAAGVPSTVSESQEIADEEEAAKTPMGEFVSQTEDRLEGSLEQMQAAKDKADAKATATKNMESIRNYLGHMQLRVGQRFVGDATDAAAAGSRLNAVQVEMANREAEWAREEAARKVEETKQSTESSLQSVVDIAKKLVEIKYAPPEEPLPEGKQPPEGYIPREEQEAHLTAQMHASYAAFLMGAHQWSSALYTKSKTSAESGMNSDAALVKLADYKSQLDSYQLMSDSPAVHKESAAVLAEVAPLLQQIRKVKTQAFEDANSASETKLKVANQLQQLKALVAQASAPAPVYDDDTQAKMERQQKVLAMLDGLNKAAQGGGSDEARAMLEKETAAVQQP